MHLDLPPSNEPDPDAQFGVPPEQITAELLELCAEFLRQASPIVHTEPSTVTTTAVSVGSLTLSASPPPSTAPRWTTILVARDSEPRAALPGLATEPVDLVDADPCNTWMEGLRG